MCATFWILAFDFAPFANCLIFVLCQICYDTDITLGTLIDRYGDEEEAQENANNNINANAGAVAPLNHVLQWGLGEVGMNDVNLASAGDGMHTLNLVVLLKMTC